MGNKHNNKINNKDNNKIVIKKNSEISHFIIIL